MRIRRNRAGPIDALAGSLHCRRPDETRRRCRGNARDGRGMCGGNCELPSWAMRASCAATTSARLLDESPTRRSPRSCSPRRPEKLIVDMRSRPLIALTDARRRPRRRLSLPHLSHPAPECAPRQERAGGHREESSRGAVPASANRPMASEHSQGARTPDAPPVKRRRGRPTTCAGLRPEARRRSRRRSRGRRRRR